VQNAKKSHNGSRLQQKKALPFPHFLSSGKPLSLFQVAPFLRKLEAPVCVLSRLLSKAEENNQREQPEQTLKKKKNDAAIDSSVSEFVDLFFDLFDLDLDLPKTSPRRRRRRRPRRALRCDRARQGPRAEALEGRSVRKEAPARGCRRDRREEDVSCF